MSAMQDAIIVKVTTPQDEAEHIADVLVRRRLAACVNIVPTVRSVYEWQGQVMQEDESLLIIKTEAALYDQVESAVKEMHSYDTPEIIAIKIERGSPEYLQWMSATLHVAKD
jgi:periplasmic divalent cation tolerance protein